jgi:signal peptidase I
VRQPRAVNLRGGWLSSLQSLAGTVVIAVFVITFIVQAFQIPSESMEDTLLIGDYLLVDKVHYAIPGRWGELLPYSDIRRGEIIVFRYPVHPSQHFVKRVIALPGDHIRLVNKQVWINGKPVAEGYVVFRSPVHDYYRDDFPDLNYLSANVEARWWLKLRALVHGGELVVPPGQYFVLGDNRDESLDSRYWGLVPRQNVIGRPMLIYWSFRNPGPYAGPRAEDGKLSRLAYMITHFMQETRWDRAFRVVR